MPCKLGWSQLKPNAWAFLSMKYNDELDYQRSIQSIFSYSVASFFPTEKWRIQSVMQKLSTPYNCLIQFWAPIKVNGSTFLSTADQPFTFYNGIDKRLSSYRNLCLNTLIPIDNKEIPFAPPARVYSRRLPEYNPDVPSYSSVEFPLLQTAIRLEIHSYYAFPVSNLHDQCLGVFEIVSTQPSLPLPNLIEWLNFESVGLYLPYSLDILFGPSKPLDDERLGDIKAGLYEILERHSLPFAQIWIPFSLPCSLKVLYRVGGSINEGPKSMYYEFEYSSEVCFIESGKALVGRAFASQGSCFCKDVTLLSIKEYPLVPSARKVRFTQSFAICLQSKCTNNFICVVECFLLPNEMVVRDTKTFLNMLLYTMKEQFPGFIVAPGKKLGQRMLVEVVKVSLSDELDSFEIGQTMPSVQSLHDGGEATKIGQRLLSVLSLQDPIKTTAIDSFCQQSNLQKENNVAAALLVPSCSSHKRDSLNCERTVEVDPLLPHPIGEAMTNRGTVNVDVAHDDHIEDTTEIIQLDSHFEQPNLETNSAGNATTNNEMIHSHKKNVIQRIEKDHGITRKMLEQHYGMTLEDAAKYLHAERRGKGSEIVLYSMEHLLEQPSDVCDLMPCKLKWSQLTSIDDSWVFWSTKQNDELDYQQSIIKSINSYSVVSICPTEKSRIQSVMEKMSTLDISLFQFWAPIKVNGSTFLSTADQPFAFYKKLDKRLSSYRKLCLDTLIPIDNEIPFGPPARVFSKLLPEYNPDVSSYSPAEFPLLQTAIPLDSYCAFPVFNIHDQQCLGVFEIVSTLPDFRRLNIIKGLNFESVGFYIPYSINKLFEPPEPLFCDIKDGISRIRKDRRIPFAQIWIPFSQSASSKVLYRAGASTYEYFSLMYHEFEYASKVYFIKSGEALVGRAFASQGSCFCKDVTKLSIEEYPLVPGARKARFTQSFAICLQSRCSPNIVCVVEYFLPRRKMAVRDTKTFLNMLLTTMKEQLPGFTVASGNELGQRMLVEVVKVSPSDELDSFEIGQTLPSVQALQDGGETTEIDSFCQQSNLQNRENNVAAALLVPSCSSDKRDSLNCEGTVEVDPSLPHPIEEAVTNRGTVNVDVAHDDHIEDTTEIMQLDSHFEQPNLETNSSGNATTNNEIIHSHKKNAIQRIEKDHGSTCKILEQHYGMTLEDTATDLLVSQATLKRKCRENEIARLPLHKTRKVNVHVSQGVSFQGAEPYVVDQQCPALSQEKGTDYLGHKISPATGKPCDKVMTLKVTYRGDIIKFQLPFSSTRVELEGEVEKRLKISLERFSIKYQDEDDDWILITTDSDLRDGMHSLRLLERTTMRLLVTPEADS